MKLFVTGAGGFLGQYTVQAAIAAGHQVRALVRPASHVPESWIGNNRIEVIKGDLRLGSKIAGYLDGVDLVVHLAAAKSGDLYDQFAGTVITTENLITAMVDAGISRIVLTSSFSVYEYQERKSNALLDEDSPLASDPSERDEYCQTKLIQERLVREAATKYEWHFIVLRPGVVFGPGNEWNGRVGFPISAKYWLCTAPRSRVPLTHVGNCATAIVAAAEQVDSKSGLTLNIVDDNIPTHLDYVRELRQCSTRQARILVAPWLLMRGLAGLAGISSKIFFRGTARLPGLLVSSRVHARCKPMRYTNEKAKASLGWTPKIAWHQGLSQGNADKLKH